MTEQSRQDAINEHIRTDPFANYMGATVDVIEPGFSRVSLQVTEEMANFHGITHGSVVFALGDMAFAAAGNSHGRTALALNVSISFLRASRPGDVLVAEAKEQHAGGRTALYDITVVDQKSGELVARSQNLVYRTREWFVPPEA